MPAIQYNSSCTRPLSNRVWRIEHTSFYDLPGDKAYANLVREECEIVNGCPLDGTHVTGMTDISISVEMHGDQIGHFIQLADHGYILVSESFAQMLKKTNFTGYTLNPSVSIVNNEMSDIEKLYIFDISGRASGTKRVMIKEEDVCRTCGKGTPVCMGCGQLNITCPNCGAFLIKNPDQILTAADKELFFWFESLPKVPIIDSDQWDQQDWFGMVGAVCGDFVSHRVKRWLDDNEVPQLEIKPAVLDLGIVAPCTYRSI